MGFKSKKESKYLSLTGMWPSKNNDLLHTGRVKGEYLEKLLEKVQEAIENDAPLVVSLWENDAKESKKDPAYKLQAFVGDAEEMPASRGSFKSKRREVEEEEEDVPIVKKKKVVEEAEEEEEEEVEEAPVKKKKKVVEEAEEEEEDEPKKPAKKTKRADW